MNIPFFQSNIDHLEESLLLETLRSGWISTGPKTAELESRFAAAFGVEHAVAVSNGTAALHLSLLVHDIGPGDEVIVPSLSFVATASAVLMAGATPVFVDVASMDDWTLSAEGVLEAISPKTRAVIPMHYGGYGCDLNAIRSIADGHGLVVVEDACHAPLGERDGIRLGTCGEAGCFSFYTNKNMTTAEGGMILFRSAEMAERARRLRSHGMTSSAFDREKGRKLYEIPEMGYNYRMDDLRASIGLAQLSKLPEENRKRERVVRRYRDRLGDCDLLTLPFSRHRGRSSHHLFPVLAQSMEARDEMIRVLAHAGIGSSIHYTPIHRFPPFRRFAHERLPLTEVIADRELSLPLFGGLTEEQVDTVVDTLL